MIQAIKNATLTDLQVKTLNIREKELTYWSSTFQTMAGQSALLAGNHKTLTPKGFCYGGLGIPIDDSISSLIAFGYLSATTCGMAFGLLCITIATFVNSNLNSSLVRDLWTRVSPSRRGRG